MTRDAHDSLALTLQPGAFRQYSELCAKKEENRKLMTDEARKDIYSAALGGDPKAQSELCGAVISEVNINLLGQLFAMSFFDVKTYGPQDFPVVKAKGNDKNFFVSSLGLNGGPPAMQKSEAAYTYQLLFGRWATPPYEFPIFNLQTGPLNYLSDAVATIQYELGLHLDVVARALLDANVKASGISSGTSPLLSLHPSIVAANIPDANYLDLSTVCAEKGKFTVEKIKRILDYTVRFTADVQPLEGGELSGAMQVRAVHCSSTRLRDLWDLAEIVALVSTDVDGEPVSPTTAPTQTITGDARGEIFRNGKLEKFFGHPFTMVPNNRLAADEVYVAMTRPAGVFHSKPSMDQAFHDTTPELAAKNAERYWAVKTGVFHQTNAQIPNYLVVKL